MHAEHMAATCDFGLIGLAVMGENLALNIESRGYQVAVFNRTTGEGRRVHRRPRPRARSSSAAIRSRSWSTALKPPRKVMMMVKAGPAVDDLIEQLMPLLSHGRHHHRRRQHATTPTPSGAPRTSRAKGLLFVGTGVSGGEEGALQGPQHDARRQRGGLAARQADLPGDRRQGRPEGRHPLLRLGRPARRRALREDGAQRHRVRRHAAHLRGVLHAEGSRWA